MAPTRVKKAFEEIEPRSRADWRGWLQENYHQKESVWVVIYKKSSGKTNLDAADVAEEALCFGWIDSVPNKIDATKFKLLVSPRKPTSAWSALNKQRVKKLISAQLMTPVGMKKIELAKRNGAWRKLETSDRLEMPAELASGLKKNTQAGAFFNSIAPSSKRAILEWINMAKTAETRGRRISETIRLASMGIRANHYKDLKKMK